MVLQPLEQLTGLLCRLGLAVHLHELVQPSTCDLGLSPIDEQAGHLQLAFRVLVEPFEDLVELFFLRFGSQSTRSSQVRSTCSSVLWLGRRQGNLPFVNNICAFASIWSEMSIPSSFPFGPTAFWNADH